MVDNSSLSRSASGEILAHLRSLRANLTKARDGLAHFKSDRVDRDKLEPAARRVDELMDMFVGDRGDTARGSLWLAQIQSGIEESTNPKAAGALHEARVAVAALLKALDPTAERQTPANGQP